MRNREDIERINRVNFRASMDAFARPGQIQEVQPLFGSVLQAMASMLLYSEVTYWYSGKEDFQMIQAICGARMTQPGEADYLFHDSTENDLLAQAQSGTAEKPEQGATLILKSANIGAEGIPVVLSGPGIETAQQTLLPVDIGFIEQLQVKNEVFPMGVDLFFLSEEKQLLGIPRTTRIEVVS